MADNYLCGKQTAIASKSEQLFENVLVETVKDMTARIYAHMQKHCVGTIGPPDFACIAHSFVHGDAEIDDVIHNDFEEPDEVYDVDMDEDVPPSTVATKNKVIPAIYKGQLGIDLKDDFAEEFCTAILQKAAEQCKYSCMAKDDKNKACTAMLPVQGHNIQKNPSMRQSAKETSIETHTKKRKPTEEVVPQLPDLQIIEEKSSPLMILSSVGVSSQNSSSQQCIQDIKGKITEQGLDAEAANQKYKKDMDILIAAHKQEIEEIKRKQQQEIQTIKDYNKETLDAIGIKRQEMEAVLSYLLRKSTQSS